MKKLYLFVYSAILLALLVTLFFRPITSINEDLGRHILLGRIIVTTHIIPTVNLLSYTFPNYPFVGTSWLSEVCYYLIVLLGGFNTLQLASFVIVFLACFLQIRFVAKRASREIVLVASTVYLLLLSTRTEIRPELFSFLFLSIFTSILFLNREKVTKKIYLLPVVELFWVNMHIYFIIGPVIIGFFIFDRLIKSRIIYDNKIKSLFTVFLLTVIVSVINPNGLRGALYPFLVFKNYGVPIVENQSVYVLYELTQSNLILFPFLLIGMVVTLSVIVRKQVRPIDWMLIMVFGILALFNYRNILLFAATTFIPFVEVLRLINKRFLPRVKKLPKKTFFIFYPLSIVLLLIIIGKAIDVNSIGFGLRDYGRGSVDFILRNNLKGKIYNNFNIGGYLAYRIYPRLVFVDNRPEAYPKEFFQKILIPIQENPLLFDRLDKKYKFDLIVVRHWDGATLENKLLSYFVNKSNFKVVYLDEYALVLLKNSSASLSLINKYHISNKNFDLKKITSADDLVHYLFFFEKVGWHYKAKEAYDRLKVVDPNLCILSDYPLLKKNRINYISSKDFNKCKMF